MELGDSFWLTLDVQVLNLHLEPSRQSLFLLAIFEIENCALCRIVQLVEGWRLIEVVTFIIVHVSCHDHHFFISQRPRVRQVLQTILAAVFVTTKNNDVVLAGLHRELDVFLIDHRWVNDLKAF